MGSGNLIFPPNSDGSVFGSIDRRSRKRSLIPNFSLSSISIDRGLTKELFGQYLLFNLNHLYLILFINDITFCRHVLLIREHDVHLTCYRGFEHIWFQDIWLEHIVFGETAHFVTLACNYQQYQKNYSTYIHLSIDREFFFYTINY